MIEILASFLTLSLLEILLGIDNIVILSLLVQRLPDRRSQDIARRGGLLLSLVFRIAFLFALTWIIKADHPLWTWGNYSISIRDLILLFGGLFLIYRGVKEIDHMFRGGRKKVQLDSSYTPSQKVSKEKHPTLLGTMLEIAFLDMLFALDSIVTAVALSDHLFVMIGANIFAIILMMAIVNWVSTFLQKNPAFKVLAIAFLILVGFTLMSEGLNFPVPKGYLYFGIGFALSIEILNTLLRGKED